jgi:hypothetical protein
MVPPAAAMQSTRRARLRGGWADKEETGMASSKLAQASGDRRLWSKATFSSRAMTPYNIIKKHQRKLF